MLAVLVPAPKAIQRAIESILKYAASLHIAGGSWPTEQPATTLSPPGLGKCRSNTQIVVPRRHCRNGSHNREQSPRSGYPSTFAFTERQYQLRTHISANAARRVGQLGLTTLGAWAECHRAESLMRAAGSRTTLRFLLNRKHSGSIKTKRWAGLGSVIRPPCRSGRLGPSSRVRDSRRACYRAVQKRSLGPLPSYVKRPARNVCFQSIIAYPAAGYPISGTSG